MITSCLCRIKTDRMTERDRQTDNCHLRYDYILFRNRQMKEIK